MPRSPIVVTETPTFERVIKKYISDYELDGLRHFLVNNPLAGSYSNKLPNEILQLDWRRDGSVIIEYLLFTNSDSFTEILLLSARSDSESQPPTAKQTKTLKGLIRNISIYGLISATKAAIIKLLEIL